VDNRAIALAVVVGTLLASACDEGSRTPPQTATPQSKTSTGGQRSSTTSAQSPDTAASSSTRPLPAELNVSIRGVSLMRGAGVTLLFHPLGGLVRLSVVGSGAFRVCPSDALGLPVAGDSSSSWSTGWLAIDCLRGSAGYTLDLPTPPNAHVGVVVTGNPSLTVSSLRITYRPQDDFAAYRLIDAPPGATPVLGRDGARGALSVVIEEECAPQAVLSVPNTRGGEEEMPSCPGQLSGVVDGTPEQGVKVKVLGTQPLSTPLISVTWPPA